MEHRTGIFYSELALMRVAVTIGSYAMPGAVELQILSLRKVFGASVPLLVSDDLSQQSGEIREVARKHGVHHWCSETHRGHFAGDFNTAVNALAFAKDQGAELAVKVSQRFLLVDPVCAEIIADYFANKDVWLAVPARLSVHTIKRAESRFFASLSIITDLLVIRVGTISPEVLKAHYESRVRNARTYVDRLVESAWANLFDVYFAAHAIFMPNFSHPYPGRAPIYLRKAQSEPADFAKVAIALGLKDYVPMLQEWSRLEVAYRPAPTFV